MDASNPERCLSEALHRKMFEMLFCKRDEGGGVTAVRFPVSEPVGVRSVGQMSGVFFMVPPWHGILPNAIGVSKANHKT